MGRVPQSLLDDHPHDGKYIESCGLCAGERVGSWRDTVAGLNDAIEDAACSRCHHLWDYHSSRCNVEKCQCAPRGDLPYRPESTTVAPSDVGADSISAPSTSVGEPIEIPPLHAARAIATVILWLRRRHEHDLARELTRTAILYDPTTEPTIAMGWLYE